MPEDQPSYREVADFYNNEYHSVVGHEGSTHDYADLLKRLEPGKDDFVLDIACGTAGWLSVVNRVSANIFGSDISGIALRTAKDRLPSAGLCLSLGEQLPFAERRFDIVTCLGSLEHFLDQKKALDEMVRVARPGAKVVILVPNSGFLTYRLGLYKGTDQTKVRETLRSIEEWKTLFRQSGLEPVDTWADLHVVNWGWISMRGWLSVPLRALQALMLLVWPLGWQYQVYFLCEIKR